MKKNPTKAPFYNLLRVAKAISFRRFTVSKDGTMVGVDMALPHSTTGWIVTADAYDARVTLYPDLECITACISFRVFGKPYVLYYL